MVFIHLFIHLLIHSHKYIYIIIRTIIFMRQNTVPGILEAFRENLSILIRACLALDPRNVLVPIVEAAQLSHEGSLLFIVNYGNRTSASIAWAQLGGCPLTHATIH